MRIKRFCVSADAAENASDNSLQSERRHIDPDLALVEVVVVRKFKLLNLSRPQPG